jgi:hypothetical protein
VALPGGWEIQYDGYEIRGNIRDGLSASIPFQMPWSLAGTFIGQLIPASSANTPGSIVWTPPFAITYRLGLRTVSLYAQSFSCKPMGWNGTPAAGGGLGFGDFFSTAKIVVEFESTRMIQGGIDDDPSGLNQLDPNNPITACEQSVQATGKVVTQANGAFTYQSGLLWAGKTVTVPVGLIQPEVRLLLKFPRIPLLPWQLLQPYIGKVNSQPVLGCVKGSLLLESAPTVITPNMDGSLSQSLGLAFAFNPDPTGKTLTGMDWNSFPYPDGSGYDIIVGKASPNPTPYSYADFTQIFQTINF